MFGPQISFYIDYSIYDFDGNAYNYIDNDYKQDGWEDCNVFDFGPVLGFGLAWAHFDIQFRTGLNLRGAGGGYYYNEFDEKISIPSEMDLYLMLSVAGYF
jgi:hypothetical protein